MKELDKTNRTYARFASDFERLTPPEDADLAALQANLSNQQRSTQ